MDGVQFKTRRKREVALKCQRFSKTICTPQIKACQHKVGKVCDDSDVGRKGDEMVRWQNEPSGGLEEAAKLMPGVTATRVVPVEKGSTDGEGAA